VSELIASSVPEEEADVCVEPERNRVRAAEGPLYEYQHMDEAVEFRDPR